MPFDFDTSEGPQPTVPGILPQHQQQYDQDQEDAVDEFINEESELDTQLSEVEKRLEKAQYYRALLTQEIFEGDYSTPAQAITEEIRTFIRIRLGVLLGVSPEAMVAKVKPLFEDDEVKILKQVAGKLLKKPSIMEPPAQPTLKKAQPPPQAPQAPQIQAMKPKAVPSLRKPVPQAPPPKQQARQPQRPVPGKKPTAKAPPVPNGEIIISIPNKDGTTTDTKYIRFEDQHLGEIYQDRKGNRFQMSTNENGEAFMKSINVQAKPSGVKPLPPLTGAQITMVSQQQAAEITGKMEKGLSIAVQHAVTSPSKE